MNIAQLLFVIVVALAITSLTTSHDKQPRIYDEDHRRYKRNK